MDETRLDWTGDDWVWGVWIGGAWIGLRPRGRQRIVLRRPLGHIQRVCDPGATAVAKHGRRPERERDGSVGEHSQHRAVAADPGSADFPAVAGVLRRLSFGDVAGFEWGSAGWSVAELVRVTYRDADPAGQVFVSGDGLVGADFPGHLGDDLQRESHRAHVPAGVGQPHPPLVAGFHCE